MGPRTLWGLLAAVALLWPDRISSAFDGVPLDRPPEAILIGLVFPCLWLFHPAFLRSRGARMLIVALVAWRIVAAAALVQDGWCVRFEPARRYARDARGAPHAWDLRADWRSPDPACSAIMTRSYQSYREFPAWFFNLPPPNDSWPLPVDLPPAAITRFRVSGFLTTTAPGNLGVDVGPGMTTSVIVDGAATPSPVALDAGSHQVVVAGTMTGKEWRLVPSWNGRDLWNGAAATVQRPSPGALQIRRQARWIPIGLTILLFALWLGSALRALQNFIVPAWTIAASLGVAMLTASAGVDRARWVMPGLLAAILVPVPRRLRNMNGAFLLVGVPWLTFVAASGLSWIGLWGLYQHGNDHWMYQRYGYRIVMQGYWLEGGSPAFWFQPLYRWISGLLHAAFGDSSVGELFWDGGCVLAGALLAFRIARQAGGFGWGIAAAATTLSVFALSNAYHLIGFGLSEISSAGLLCMAAHCAIRSRNGSVRTAIAAGVLATLAFYTRLNNLPMALGVAAFALPIGLPAGALVRPAAWLRRVSFTTLLVGPAIGLGLLLLAWRVWYYTGVFSILHGTQFQRLALWQPGVPIRTLVVRMIESVMMVLSVNDPPQFDFAALPVLLGALAAVASVLGLPRLRAVPAPAVLFFFSGIAGAFLARGSAYPGRFSVHIIPITCALTACALAALGSRRWALGRSRRSHLPHSSGIESRKSKASV